MKTTTLRTRKARTAERRRIFWEEKNSRARTPEDRARVACDHLWAVLKQLPEDKQARVWARLTEALEGLLRALTQGDR